MANTLLSPTVITREALRVLHGKLTFIGSINRQYDDQFARKGAKIGSNLSVRMPNKFVVQSGAALNVQDVEEKTVVVPVTSQKHVDFTFSSTELTLTIDEFSKRYIEPAMAQLAAVMEGDAFGMALDVPQVVNGLGNPITWKNVLNARKMLMDNLAPTSDRSLILNTQDNVDLVDTLKGLFQSSGEIASQYRDGLMGRTGGYDVLESTLIKTQLTGTCASTTGYAVNGAGQTGSQVLLKTGANTFKKGDVITFAGCYRVHPETKDVTGDLMQFVVTEDYPGGAGNVKISPAIVVSNAAGHQNVSASPTADGAVLKVGGASQVYKPSLAFHKDAFTFATADLVMPEGVDFASRQVYDGISMRIVRQYSIATDTFPCRIDVLYGYKTLRESQAVRILSN
ncbi:MAG TPA: P22 phage major capsid protein family protein [Rubrivivax sp.]|nr:P22 phage major capsid protein family protein [Rubrivivax sp.]